jgi:hypothetical protein
VWSSSSSPTIAVVPAPPKGSSTVQGTGRASGHRHDISHPTNTLDDHGTADDRLRAQFIRGQIAAFRKNEVNNYNFEMPNHRQLALGAQVNDLLTRNVWGEPHVPDGLGYKIPRSRLALLEIRNRSRSHRCVWRRGFPDEVECPFRVWFFGAHRWLAAHPIRRATVTVPGGVTAYFTERENGRSTFTLCNGGWLKFPHFKCTVSQRLVDDLKVHREAREANEVLFYLALGQTFPGVRFALRGVVMTEYRGFTAEGRIQ